MPLRVIERSARLAAVVPVIGVGLPVVGFGALCGLALSGGRVVTQGSSGVILLIGQVVTGIVLVWAAGAARRAGAAEGKCELIGVVHKGKSGPAWSMKGCEHA